MGRNHDVVNAGEASRIDVPEEGGDQIKVFILVHKLIIEENQLVHLYGHLRFVVIDETDGYLA